MTSNVTAVLVVAVVCAAAVALTWIAKGTSLFLAALVGGVALIAVALRVARSIADNVDGE